MTLHFAVIGYPVEHSLSPAMHNAVFKKLKEDAVYEKVEVAPENLERFIQQIRGGRFSGVNVTIPHKISVMEYLDEISPEARLIGAVNTIKQDKGRLLGYNTDGIGCVEAFNAAGFNPKGKKIVVVGAGGAARAVLFQLLLSGAEKIVLVNRTLHKAQAITEEIEEKRKSLNATGTVEATEYRPDSLKAAIKNADALVNTTPVGMHPRISETPFPAEYFKKGLTVMDVVYNPLKTRFLREAESAGCSTIDGIGMFVMQGAASQKIWLSRSPPVNVMRDAVMAALSKTAV
ncbi:Shikimate dehydrogenase (NADP(+)) [uncultured archaeon]|nr:Shikimate dehydrogenase (NADP(+)) [uncultured archaeon]